MRYPFGYGLSYTTFDWEDMQITDLGKRIQVSCTVKNTGTRDCAEVVQLYVAAPESAVWKPKRELRAFAKVYLKAGEQRRVELSLTRMICGILTFTEMIGSWSKAHMSFYCALIARQ